MFERYGESARRVLLFARQEAGQLDQALVERGEDVSVESKELLLGLLRESGAVACRILAEFHITLEEARNEIARSGTQRVQTSPPDEEGLGIEAKRALRFAEQEASRLLHDTVDTEHLLLGILCDEGTVAASILATHGMHVNEVRDRIVLLRTDPQPGWSQFSMTDALRREVIKRPDLPRTPGVHIAPAARGAAGGETGGDDFWALEGFDLKSVLSRIFVSDHTVFPETRIELPEPLDSGERYDFVLVLAPRQTSGMRNRLMQEGIERYFNVRIALESRPMDVYVLTAPGGQTAAIQDAPAFNGGGIGGMGLSFAIRDFDQAAPTAESFEARYPTMEAWRNAMSHSMIGGISISNGTMEEFCHTLEQGIGRPVVDETGLTGRYNVELHDERDDEPSTARFVERLRRQLGLALTPGRRSVPILVVRAS